MLTGELNLNLVPVWFDLDAVRKECDAFLESLNYTADVRESMCMITSEFLENAIKYGSFSGMRNSIPVTIISAEGGHIMVKVCSPVDSRPSNKWRNLDLMLQQLQNSPSPFHAYLDRMNEISQKPLDDAESGLGLARIGYEGAAKIHYYVDENSFLVLCATRHTG